MERFKPCYLAENVPSSCFYGISELQMNYKNILHSLVEYAFRYGKASPAKRLGWALERLEIQAKFLDPLENVPIKGFRSLDPTRSRRGPYDKRWMIRNNRISLQESVES
jgi:predicted transcriptional regulator of viral defense system